MTGPVTVSKNGGAILTCTLSGITASTAVTWLTSARAIGDSNSNYNKNSNAFNLADGSQVHTLSISSAELSPPSMIYTCRFEPAAGVQLTDTYTLNIINPGEQIYFSLMVERISILLFTWLTIHNKAP